MEWAKKCLMCCINLPSIWLNKELAMINNLRLLALLGAIFLMPSLVSMISSDSVLASSVIAAEEKKRA